jgi:hypothetical protein
VNEASNTKETSHAIHQPVAIKVEQRRSRNQTNAAGLKHSRDLIDTPCEIREVTQHFDAEHKIKASIGKRKMIDVRALYLCSRIVGPSVRDHLFGAVDPRDFKSSFAKTRHVMAGAAADIQ